MKSEGGRGAEGDVSERVLPLQYGIDVEEPVQQRCNVHDTAHNCDIPHATRLLWSNIQPTSNPQQCNVSHSTQDVRRSVQHLSSTQPTSTRGSLSMLTACSARPPILYMGAQPRHSSLAYSSCALAQDSKAYEPPTSGRKCCCMLHDAQCMLSVSLRPHLRSRMRRCTSSLPSSPSSRFACATAAG